MTKLEKIIKEAQKMRKAHPKKYAKWTDYIKEASKSIAGYVGTKKTATTTTVNYTRKVTAKKTKPATQAKLFGNKTHKDTKSHNVNIRVVSGVKPHKGKYYINYKYEGSEITKYFDKLPKNLYKASNGIMYLMVLTDDGTALTPLINAKTETVVKKAIK